MEEMIEYSRKFTEVATKNLQLFDIESDVVLPPSEIKGVETSRDFIVTVLFTGTVYGEYLLALDEITAARIIGHEDEINDENRQEVRDDICDALKEILNTIVGESIVGVQELHPKLTLTAPRVCFGEIRYPAFRTAKSVLRTDAGEIECFFCLDLMRLTLADSYAQAMQSLEDANRQLESANGQLREEIDEHIRTQKERDECHDELVAASRLAGMAEVATSVLHNVGNALNSVNVSANLIRDRMSRSPVENLQKASDIIEQNQSDLAQFLESDQRGKHFPGFLKSISHKLTSERDAQLEEVHAMAKNIDHIKEIVSAQQRFARKGGVVETVNLIELFEDALSISDINFERHGIELTKEFEDLPVLEAKKHDILQILINLIRNARDAVDRSNAQQKQIRLIAKIEGDEIVLAVTDNGIGISAEDEAKIFQHGFTTKESGHGFGLHSCANSATEMNGRMSFSSEGAGKGATFTLTLPIQAASIAC